MLRPLLFVLLLVVPMAQQGCIWKLWTKEPIEERTFDVYGNVQSVTEKGLVVETKKGEQTFVLVSSSIKGGDFEIGTYVHVYYKKQGDQNVVTMVVEKIK